MRLPGREGFGKFNVRPLDGTPDQTQSFDINDKTKWVIPFAYPHPGLEPESQASSTGISTSGTATRNASSSASSGSRRTGLPRPVSTAFVFRTITSTSPTPAIIKGSTYGSRRRNDPGPFADEGYNGQGINGLDFTRDDKTLVGCGLYEVRLFDVASGKELLDPGHRTRVLTSVTPDQKTVATADVDGTIRLWDCAMGPNGACWR